MHPWKGIQINRLCPYSLLINRLLRFLKQTVFPNRLHTFKETIPKNCLYLQKGIIINLKVGYSSGLHIWEVCWPVRQRGTHAVMGVGTGDASLHAAGYQSLVGNDDQSWGWDIGRLKVKYLLWLQSY